MEEVRREATVSVYNHLSWFGATFLVVMDWLPHSPDLNMNEAVWERTEKKRQKDPKHKEMRGDLRLWRSTVTKIKRYGID